MHRCQENIGVVITDVIVVFMTGRAGEGVICATTSMHAVLGIGFVFVMTAVSEVVDTIVRVHRIPSIAASAIRGHAFARRITVAGIASSSGGPAAGGVVVTVTIDAVPAGVVP